ncbi:helix-turn-helix domain-containing protein [Virgibacillus siamensis]|uniref:helix-turn-helix domain-containing protein n=1 Tax=Virgibacillus siamensis TaxID=480071 RepID=UPI000986D98F|nr:cupin domain-containing protein [Virgibacillus siamensis]
MTDELGTKIKQLRKQQKLTLKQIAEDTGLSISFLSQLEHSKTSVTLESLKKISESLNVNPSYFFAKPQTASTSTVVRHESVETELRENKFIYRDLSGGMDNPLFSPILIILNPGDNRGSNFSHKGQEFLYVLEGTLTIHIEGEEHVLHPHDSIFLQSSKSHYWLNQTDQTIKFLCVSAVG